MGNIQKNRSPSFPPKFPTLVHGSFSQRTHVLVLFFEKPLFVQPKTKSTIPQKEEAKTLHKEFFSIHQTIKLIHIEI